MKNLFITVCCFINICFVSGQTVQMVQDSRNIQALLDVLSEAFNKHDARAYSMAFSEEADFTSTLGVNIYGRDSIEKVLEKSFTTAFKNNSLTFTGKRIRYVTNDIIAVDVSWEMTGTKVQAGKDISLRKGLANLLLTRSGAQWLILIMHNMNLPGS